jgi:hypothetical protein
MASYFCNCGENQANFELCLKNNVAGFPSTGYQTGDLVFLIVKINSRWNLGARGTLLESTNNKPWNDADNYKSSFKANWEPINKQDVTEGLRKIYHPNFGLAIQGKKDINTFQNKGDELKEFFNNFFITSTLLK